ncbi:hypothetical protein MTYP_01026 [Methylophilaceae bacterium]|nr:hypothetical protein MTYP_01026 [Methylophilaceae bacterium]
MAKRPPLPFAEIADQALRSSDSLVARWLPGGVTKGGEYSVTNPNRHDNKPGSFSINLNTGAWGDFATDDKGGDLISLYAYLQGMDQYEAALEVADQVAFKLPANVEKWRGQQGAVERKAPVVDPASVKEKKVRPESPWVPVLPVPDYAPPPHAAHKFRGKPERTWCYKDADRKVLGYIYRFATSDGGKETIPHILCRHKTDGTLDWQWLQFPEPRPLYGLDRLDAKPDAWVLLVEGEKCADAPVELLNKAVVVSWPGGSKAVDKVDWSPLAGRNVYAWADCDAKHVPLTKAEKEAGVLPESKPLLPEHEQPGVKAMLKIREHLLALDSELDTETKFNFVDIPAPAEKPDGWDVADAIDEGMDAQALLRFVMQTRAQLPAPADTADAGDSKQPHTPNSATAGERGKSATWVDYMLRKSGDLVPCLANAYDILLNDEKWRGVLAYDEFSQRVMKLRPPPFYGGVGEAGEWSGQDDAHAAMWLTRTYRISVSPSLAAEAVENVARRNTINPPRDWLNGLEWDGQHRVDSWLLDYLGVPLTDYSRRVARWFLMGIVKRVMQPGCKFDYCLVLEGPQGRKKSTAMAALGGEWFGDTDLDLHNKDSMSALRGKMLYEFSELGSLARSEEKRQKSFLSRTIDEYRPVYGRREIRQPRQLVFCGTTNEWEWNKDPTGGRRFWPVRVEQEADIEGLLEARDQLFAEAVQMVLDGHRYWPTTAEQAKFFDPEQLSRSMPDSLVDALHDHVMDYGGSEFSLHYAATEWLKLDIAKLTRDMQTRIGMALRQLGCTKHEKKGNAVSRFWYKAPAIKEPTSTGGTQFAQGDDDHVPF